MSFLKRLFGLTDDRRGELLTSVSDQTWVSDSGEVIQQVSEDICVSMTGTVYTQINDTTVVTSDGDVFTRIRGAVNSDRSLTQQPQARDRPVQAPARCEPSSRCLVCSSRAAVF